MYKIPAEDFFIIADRIHNMEKFLNELRLIEGSSSKEFAQKVNIIELLKLYIDCVANTDKFVHGALELGHGISVVYPVNCYPKLGYYALNDGFVISKKDDGKYRIDIGAYRDFRKNGHYGDDLDLFRPKTYTVDSFKLVRISNEKLKLQFNGMIMQFTYRYMTFSFI